MKTLKKLKLNNWAEAQLSNSNLRELRGGNPGRYCYGGCFPSKEAEENRLKDEEEKRVIIPLTFPPEPLPNPTPLPELITPTPSLNWTTT